MRTDGVTSFLGQSMLGYRVGSHTASPLLPVERMLGPAGSRAPENARASRKLYVKRSCLSISQLWIMMF
ncbi:hypothetical protein RRG08_053487 [Elysia crispata]|uniref:Uncharacterized protein n=1 Tax=Elysia crispata TaxID=231223 RepID=A0AAE1A0D7_9GAST|nr:hypothetical protein RRG08_053487 [Elysia crispata]